MNFLKRFYAFFTGLIAFIIYLTTLAPSVIQIDSGELAAVQSSGGIAHPTGYPLFTILGYLFTQIPFPSDKIFLLNILSAIWCSAGVGIFTYTSKLILDNIHQFNPVKITASKSPTKKKKKEKAADKIEIKNYQIPEIKKYISAIAGGLTLAFSKTFWLQSTSVEVYSLHIFLLSLIILFLIKAYLQNDSQIKNGDKLSLKNNWYLFAFFLALGFSNHMTTLLVLPGAAYLFFLKYRFNKVSIKKIIRLFVVFSPVLFLLYSYLPLRASQNPVINWGNPVDPESIYRHISGKQYQVWLFTSAEAAKKQLVYFFDNIPAEFNISLFIIIFGITASFFTAKRFFIFLLISFVTALLYSINYDINDIDSYFLLAYISLAFFSVFGVEKLLAVLKFRKYSYSLTASLIAVFIIVLIYINYYKVDQSKIFIFEDYTKELLRSTENNSVIFSYQWDFFISPSYYFQFVENYRRNTAIIDKELLRRSWYYNQLNTAYPGVLNGLEDEIKSFNKALVPFEQGGNYDANLLENLYRRIMTGLVENNINERAFYIAPEVFENEMQSGDFTLPAGYTLVPDIFLFKVVKGNSYIPAADPDFEIRFPEKKNYYTNFIENTIASMLARRALYEIQFDKIDRSGVYIDKIKKDLPDYKIPAALLNVLGQ